MRGALRKEAEKGEEEIFVPRSQFVSLLCAGPSMEDDEWGGCALVSQILSGYDMRQTVTKAAVLETSNAKAADDETLLDPEGAKEGLEHESTRGLRGLFHTSMPPGPWAKEEVAYRALSTVCLWSWITSLDWQSPFNRRSNQLTLALSNMSRLRFYILWLLRASPWIPLSFPPANPSEDFVPTVMALYSVYNVVYVLKQNTLPYS